MQKGSTSRHHKGQVSRASNTCHFTLALSCNVTSSIITSGRGHLTVAAGDYKDARSTYLPLAMAT